MASSLLHVPLYPKNKATGLEITHNQLNPPSEAIASEKHDDEVQIITVLEGQLLVWMSRRPIPDDDPSASKSMPLLLSEHCSVSIPAGLYHRLEQHGARPVKFISIYHHVGAAVAEKRK